MNHPGHVRFVGVGEAFAASDALNTSVLVVGSQTLLFDCGPSIPAALFGFGLHPDAIDGVFVSHLHGDHVFGLPFLLARLHEDGRTKPLQILCGPAADGEGVLAHVLSLSRLAYGSIFAKLGYPLEEVVVAPGQPRDWGRARLATAESAHARRNHALSFQQDGVRVGLSGDGDFTPATRALFAGSDLLIHEAFQAEEGHVSHGSVDAVLAYARSAGIRNVALVHLSRHLRPIIEGVLAARDTAGLSVFVPAPGDLVPWSAL